MVLDLRLNEKIGLSGDNLLFFERVFRCIGGLFRFFLQKSAELFAHVKKKQYLCTRFRKFCISVKLPEGWVSG